MAAHRRAWKRQRLRKRLGERHRVAHGYGRDHAGRRARDGGRLRLGMVVDLKGQPTGATTASASKVSFDDTMIDTADEVQLE